MKHRPPDRSAPAKHNEPAEPARGSTTPSVQGEGDYEAARRFDQAEQEFVQSGKVRDAAQRARPKDDEEKREMERAEATGRGHAKDEDPAVRR